jgi:hypothetical protein
MTPGETEAEMCRLAALLRENAMCSQRAYEKRLAERRELELKRQRLWR